MEDSQSNYDNSERTISDSLSGHENYDYKQMNHNQERVLSMDDNRDVYDVNYGLGTLDSFIKLKETVRNVPVHKLMTLIEKEAEYTKNQLSEGKKQRRILESQFITLDNEANHCAHKLCTNFINNLSNFKDDMRKMIKENMDITSKISQEVYELRIDLANIRKDYSAIEAFITQEEDNLGMVDYHVGFK